MLPARVNFLQRERDELKQQVEEKNRLINAGAITLQTAQSQLTIAQNQNQQKDAEITQLSNNLRTKETQIGQLNAEIATKNGEITRITNEKDQVIKGLKSEITEKEKEIISLKVQLGVLSPEEVLKNKINLKKRELDSIVCGLSLNRQTVISLCDAYEKLGLARLNYNQENITSTKNDIKNIEEGFFAATNDNDKLYEVYQSCEQIAKWNIELEQLYQQQYQARQEVPQPN